MTKFFNKFKKPCFGLFLGQDFFSRKSGSVTLNSNRFLAPYQNLEKTNVTRKRPERRKDRQKDGRM